MKIRAFCLMIFMALFAISSVRAQLLINEVMSNNTSGISDASGNYEDWIELYNSSQQEISLQHYYLSDKKNDLHKWMFPPDIIIPAETFILIWASGKNRVLGDELHTNFGLSKDGEALYLYHEGKVLDSIHFPNLHENISFGRLRDSMAHYLFSTPSPGRHNEPQDVLQASGLELGPFDFITTTPHARIPLHTTGPCPILKYSIDGSIPNKVLGNVDSIFIHRTQNLAPYFSLIPTLESYRPPLVVPRFHHLRASCSDTQGQVLKEVSTTIILNREKLDVHSLPILFIDAYEEDFFGAETGIYVAGNNKNFEQNGRHWKKDVRWYYIFQDDKLHSGTATVEIHGHSTRYLPQKSLKLTQVKSETRPHPWLNGSHLNSFVARSFHSEWIKNEYTDFGFRDDLVMHAIAGEMKVYAQKTELIIVYVNGEYWGLHSLRENSDEDAISMATGVPLDEIIIEGGAEHIFQLYQQVASLSPSDPALYHRLEELFDMDNLVDYILVQIWFNNHDWPHNNIKTWREKTGDGRYHFVLFDMDATFKFPGTPTFERFRPENIPTRANKDHYLFWEKVLNIPAFRNRLIDRYLELNSTLFSVTHLQSTIEEVARTLSPEISRHRQRWHYPRSREVWEKSVEDIQDFILKRKLNFNVELTQFLDVQISPNPTKSGSYIVLSDAQRHTQYQWIFPNGLTGPWVELKSPEIVLPEPNLTGIHYLRLKSSVGIQILPVVVQ